MPLFLSYKIENKKQDAEKSAQKRRIRGGPERKMIQAESNEKYARK